MHRVLRLIVVASLLTATALAGPAALRPVSLAAAQQVPTFRSTIEAVQVTAIVTGADGRPVPGLTRDDFEIVENGTPQPITTFTAVDIPLEPGEPSGPETDVLGNDGPEGRVYVIALDEVAPINALRTRQFLRQFIETSFGPHDVAAVVLLGRGLGTDGQDFTGNRRLLLQAIDKFGGGGDDSDDPFAGRRKMGGFRDLIEFLATVRTRRKAMILVSEGIGHDAYDLVDYRGGVLSIDGEDFQQAVSAATRSNVAIYPVDPRGLDPDVTGAGIGSDLRALAEVTGGAALTNSNNFTAAFEQIVRDNSTYYVLGFNSAYEKRDAHWVNVSVRVKRPGLIVRSLDGYVAPRGRRKTEPERRNVLLAAVWDAVASPLATSGVPMRVFAAAYRGPDKNATVAVALEIAGVRLDLVERDGAYRGELEVVLAVTDARKKRWPLIRHRLALALKPETYARVSRSGLRFVCELALPKGRYQVRVSAGGASRAGSVVYDLTVPDFADDLEISGVSVSSAQTNEALTVSPHPRLRVALPAPPTTAREFTRDDNLMLFAEVYENRHRPHTVTFTSELRDASGMLVATSSGQRKKTDASKKASLYRFTPSLVLDDLPPGRYVLHLEARSSLDTRASVSHDVAITVRP